MNKFLTMIFALSTATSAQASTEFFCETSGSDPEYLIVQSETHFEDSRIKPPEWVTEYTYKWLHGAPVFETKFVGDSLKSETSNPNFTTLKAVLGDSSGNATKVINTLEITKRIGNCPRCSPYMFDWHATLKHEGVAQVFKCSQL